MDVLFYATDHLGSTILAVDANQTIQTRNLYMPFGDPGAVQEGTALRHRYIGGVILEESGLYARTGASSPRPLYLTECLLIGPKENAA